MPRPHRVFALAAALCVPGSVSAAPAPDVVPVDSPPTPTAAELTPPEFEDPLTNSLARVEGGLSADEVARRATPSAPGLQERHAELRKAAAQLDQTMYSFFPKLQAEGSYARVSEVNVNFEDGGGTMLPPGVELPSFDVPLNQWSLQASLGVPISDYALSLVPAYRGSKARRKAAELARQAERLKVQADARVAYYNWVRAVAQVVVAEDSLERTRARLEDARAVFEAGMASRADVLRLDAAVAATESLLVESEAFRELSARTLAMLMDEELGTYTIGEDVLGPARAPGDASIDELIRQGQSNRLELRAVERNVVGVRKGINATRADYFPRLDGFAEVTYANPNQRFFPQQNEWNTSWSVGLSLTWKITQTLMTSAVIKEYKADASRFEAQLAGMKRAIQVEVTRAYIDRRTALAKIHLATRARAAAEETYRVAADRFRVGNATSLEVVEAEADRVQASLQDINARIDVRVAATRLDHATGRQKPL